jgi:alkylated DNA repair dioxygenase AlkB
MPQLALFEAEEDVLVDDEEGKFAYRPHFVPRSLADAWFEELRTAAPWHSQRRMMYDREVDVPRLMAHFELLPQPAEGITPCLIDVSARVTEATGVAFTSVGLNLYRNGDDSVAPHNDHLDTLRPGHPIALVSLGSTRRMTLRRKKPPHRILHVDLGPGSLLTMSYETQVHYTHGIPKTAEPVAERISLAFRVTTEAGPQYRG